MLKSRCKGETMIGNFNKFYDSEVPIYEQYQGKEIGKIVCDLRPCSEGYKLFCDKNDLIQSGRYIVFGGAWYTIEKTEIYSFGIKTIISRINENTIIDKILTEKGYMEFSVPNFYPEHIVRYFQKRFDDKIGKKYFINVHKWFNKSLDKNKEIQSIYEFEVVLSKIDTDLPVKMLFYAGWNIADVEDYAEKLFQTGLFSYYEEWDEC